MQLLPHPDPSKITFTEMQPMQPIITYSPTRSPCSLIITHSIICQCQCDFPAILKCPFCVENSLGRFTLLQGRFILLQGRFIFLPGRFILLRGCFIGFAGINEGSTCSALQFSLILHLCNKQKYMKTEKVFT